MPPAEFEPATPASDRPQTLTLDLSASGIGRFKPSNPSIERLHSYAVDHSVTGIGILIYAFHSSTAIVGPDLFKLRFS